MCGAFPNASPTMTTNKENSAYNGTQGCGAARCRVAGGHSRLTFLSPRLESPAPMALSFLDHSFQERNSRGLSEPLRIQAGHTVLRGFPTFINPKLDNIAALELHLLKLQTEDSACDTSISIVLHNTYLVKKGFALCASNTNVSY